MREQWTINPETGEIGFFDEDVYHPVSRLLGTTEEDLKGGRRIVAAMNAVAGLSTDALEKEGIEEMVSILHKSEIQLAYGHAPDPEMQKTMHKALVTVLTNIGRTKG